MKQRTDNSGAGFKKAKDMNWIKIEFLEDLPTSGNFLVCQDLDAVANVYWDQVPLSDGENLFIETFDGPKIEYEYTPTHYIVLD